MRALRVDVTDRKLAPAGLLRDFHRAHPEVELDVVTLVDATAAVAAIGSATTDASFRAVTVPARLLPDRIEAVRILDEPIQLLTGPAHEPAGAGSVTPARLAGPRIWMPGSIAGTEWASYYGDLAAAFGLTIDAIGPRLGTEPLLDAIAGSATLATFVGEQTRMLWPADYDRRRVAVHDPTPVYPHPLIRRDDIPRPALVTLRAHLGSALAIGPDGGTWTPGWATAPPVRGSGDTDLGRPVSRAVPGAASRRA